MRPLLYRLSYLADEGANHKHLGYWGQVKNSLVQPRPRAGRDARALRRSRGCIEREDRREATARRWRGTRSSERRSSGRRSTDRDQTGPAAMPVLCGSGLRSSADASTAASPAPRIDGCNMAGLASTTPALCKPCIHCKAVVRGALVATGATGVYASGRAIRGDYPRLLVTAARCGLLAAGIVERVFPRAIEHARAISGTGVHSRRMWFQSDSRAQPRMRATLSRVCSPSCPARAGSDRGRTPAAPCVW
jgi:hypothetical protein